MRAGLALGILPAMSRRSPFAVFLWLLAIALLPLRTANAHLHVCADGHEPGVSVELEYAPAQCSILDPDSGHKDRDVKLPAQLVAAKASGGDDAAVLALLHFVVLAIAPPDDGRPHETSDFSAPRPVDPVLLSPPSRGPPA
jgi:hypothetical protein